MEDEIDMISESESSMIEYSEVSHSLFWSIDCKREIECDDYRNSSSGSYCERCSKSEFAKSYILLLSVEVSNISNEFSSEF